MGTAQFDPNAPYSSAAVAGKTFDPNAPYSATAPTAGANTAGFAPPPGTPGVPRPPNPIFTAPEESGLETGPLVSYRPEENDTVRHGAGTDRALARMIHAAGQALNPVTQIPAMFHAAVDQPQDSQQAAEEQGAEAGGASVGAPPALSRFLYRTAGKPIANAVQDYSAGRVTPEAALSVAPEAIGLGAGTVVGGKVAEMGLGKLIDAAVPKPVNADLVANTYSKAGDNLAASLRSNTKVDVPAETKIAAPAIEEGLNDRGISTQDFKGRNGPQALQSGIDNALDIQEARAKSVIDPIRGEKVDPQVLAENPELAARLQGKKDVTYGDIDAERIKLNKELRTSNFYSKPPSAQYAVADPMADAHAAVGQARDLVYGKAEQATGVNLRPLKQTESSLIKLGDLAETTKNTLSAKAAQRTAAPLYKKAWGSAQGVLSAKANPVNAFSIPEKAGLFDPTGEFNANMKRAFPNLKAAAANRTVKFPNYNLSLTPSGTMPPPLQQILNLSGGENVPGENLALTHPEGKTPPELNAQEPLPLEGGQNIPAAAIPDILGRALIGKPLTLESPGGMPPALQRVLGFENPGVPSEAYPGVTKAVRKK